jgi:beta-catenin-like protein 1
MASIDDLFRAPYTTHTKRKHDPTSTFTSTSNKAPRTGSATSPHTNGSHYAGGIPKLKIASVEDELLPSADDEDDIEAGPTMPSDEEDEEANAEDSDGRFFGGGVSKSSREVLDYVNGTDDGPDEVIDSTWLRKTALAFERKISKNAEMRAKYEGEPEKFMASEADLDEGVKGLGILAEHGELYTEFVEMGCVGSLVGLLSHENTDIAISVVNLLEELTGEDGEVEDTQWKALVRAMSEADVVGLLIQNLSRLNEQRSEDREGVYHILSVLENLLADSTNLSAQPSLVTWLHTRISLRISSPHILQNQQYATEILATLLQSTGPANRESFISLSGIDTLLELLSAYRKRDPEKDSDEAEWVANLFDALTCLVDTASGATAFLAGEGVELSLIMLHEGKLSKSRALTVLDHAMGGGAAEAVCEKVVEAAGLKTLFGMFMKRQDRQATEHLIGIFASLLRYLSAGSSGRIRTLAKFVEREYEKIAKLVTLRAEYASKLRVLDAEIEREREGLTPKEQEEMADEWLSRQLDAGLFPLQTLDVVLAWLVAEDDGARKKVEDLMGGVEELKESLMGQIAGIQVGEDDDGEAVGRAKTGREMLEALVRCL